MTLVFMLCSSNSVDAADSCSNVLLNLNLSSSQLSTTERAIIKNYTLGAYREINESLRNKLIPNNDIRSDIFEFDRALQKLPNSPGISYRGTMLSDQQVQTMLKAGNHFTFPSFTSADIHRDRAEGFSSEHYLLVIEGKTGKNVRKYSSNILETEIIFRRDTIFEVVSTGVETDTFGHPRKTIHIREVSRAYEELPADVNPAIRTRFLDKLLDEGFHQLVTEYYNTQEPDKKWSYIKHMVERLELLGSSERKNILDLSRLLENLTLYLPGLGKYQLLTEHELLKAVASSELTEVRASIDFLRSNSIGDLNNPDVIRHLLKIIRKLKLNPAQRYTSSEYDWSFLSSQQEFVVTSEIKREAEIFESQIAKQLLVIVRSSQN